MEAGPSKQQPKATSSRGSRIRRGQACASCRQLKIKCDGAKPKCGPCTRIRRMHPCEYGDEQVNARIRTLEGDIDVLRQRIRELENPEQSRPSTSDTTGPPVLQDSYPTPTSLSNQEMRGLPTTSARTVSSSGLSPADDPDVSSMASRLQTRDTGIRLLGSRLSSADRESSIFTLSLERRALLIQTFISSSDYLGFFLNTERLLNTLITHLNPGNSLSETPSPSLMACVFLWGLHLLNIRSTHPAEPTFLEEAIKLTATALLPTSWNPSLILDTIQAYLLLALYLLCRGKFDLSRIHSTAAVSLVVAHNLHRFSLTNDGLAVWQIVVHEKTMAAALNSVSSPVTHASGIEASGVMIDVPWPGDSPVQGGADKVASFLEGLENDSGLSLSAQYVKSVILFHQAFYMADQWVLGLHHMQIGVYTALDNLITTFKAFTLATLHDGGNLRLTLLIRSVLNGAIIRLHLPFAAGDESSSAKCISAAREIVDLASQLVGYDQRSGWCHPTFGTVWTDACIVFAGEIKRSRSHVQIGSSFRSQGEGQYIELLRRMTGIMTLYSEGNVLMGLQARKIGEVLASLGL